MSWAAANVCADEQQSISAKVRENNEADTANKILYERAIQVQKEGRTEVARSIYKELLQHARLQYVLHDMTYKKSAQVDGDGKFEEDQLSPGNRKLRVLCLNNFGQLEEAVEQFSSALKCYHESLMLDSSRTRIWHRLGVVAIRLSRYRLARYAFEQGLRLNPGHISCRQKLINLLDFLGDTCRAKQLKADQRPSLLQLSSLKLPKQHHPLGPSQREALQTCYTTIQLPSYAQWESLVLACATAIENRSKSHQSYRINDAPTKSVNILFKSKTTESLASKATSNASKGVKLAHRIDTDFECSESIDQISNDVAPRKSQKIEDKTNSSLREEVVSLSSSSTGKPVALHNETPKSQKADNNAVAPVVSSTAHSVDNSKPSNAALQNKPARPKRNRPKSKRAKVGNDQKRRKSKRFLARQEEEAQRAIVEEQRNNLRFLMKDALLQASSLEDAFHISLKHISHFQRCEASFPVVFYKDGASREDSSTSSIHEQDERSMSEIFFGIHHRQTRLRHNQRGRLTPEDRHKYIFERLLTFFSKSNSQNKHLAIVEKIKKARST